MSATRGVLAVLLLIAARSARPEEECGTERWAVKIAADGAQLREANPPGVQTVAQLSALEAPKYRGGRPREGAELVVVQVVGYLELCECGHPRDFHLDPLPAACQFGMTDPAALGPGEDGYGCECIGWKPRPVLIFHASTLAFPEVESDAFDNLCGRLGLFAEELTEGLAQVNCPDCLRAIAEWGLAQAQGACGLALELGRVRSDLDGALQLLARELARKLIASLDQGAERAS